ncbi:hypothetical protein [Anabaena catenula]|uniref:Peptidase M10 metallopeptidase domain-containing protein n=1 Tax=Anabaena catenula FACHB-362 TaxID=2692877 RepID=A0ABR8J1S9_9NOST|nr:hypothetical protein [Anabaena catenula]MBD2692080.1 hypothetical protein [Anabaena catenula FACHB-362]
MKKFSQPTPYFCIENLVQAVFRSPEATSGGWGGPRIGGWNATDPLTKVGMLTINAQVSWTDSYLYSAISHELGHVLGLLGLNSQSSELIDDSSPTTAVFRGEYARVANGGSYIPLQSQDGPNPITNEYDYFHPAGNVNSIMSYGNLATAPTNIDFAMLADSGYRVYGVNA